MRHAARTSYTQSCRSSKHPSVNSSRAGCAAGETHTLVTMLRRILLCSSPYVSVGHKEPAAAY